MGAWHGPDLVPPDLATQVRNGLWQQGPMLSASWWLLRRPLSRASRRRELTREPWEVKEDSIHSVPRSPSSFFVSMAVSLVLTLLWLGKWGKGVHSRAATFSLSGAAGLSPVNSDGRRRGEALAPLPQPGGTLLFHGRSQSSAARRPLRASVPRRRPCCAPGCLGDSRWPALRATDLSCCPENSEASLRTGNV